MTRFLFLALLLPAAAMAQDDCYTWIPTEKPAVKRVHAPNTTPKRVQKPAKSVHVQRKAKRVKRKSAVPSIGTTKPLPTLVRVPVECPARPPVTEVFLPPGMTPPQPRTPGLLPPSMPYSPHVGHTPVPTAPATPPEWFAGPLAVITPGGFANDEQSNDLPTSVPDGSNHPESPGSSPVPVPGTLLLLAIGTALLVRKAR